MNPNKRLSTIKVVLISITAILAICLVISVAYIATLPSGSKSLNLSAALSEMVGVVEVQNSGHDPSIPVNNGFVLKSTMQLQTKEKSRVRLDLSSGSIVRLGQLTIFSLESQQASTQGGLLQIELQAGRVWVILNGGSLDVNTPAGLASVRGSYMSVWVEPNTNRITVCCLEGKCSYKNTAGVVEMTSGQKIISSNTNGLPSIDKMDQTDVQSWLDNSPESLAIIPQITSLVASSTLSATPTPTSTPTLTSSPTPTLTPTLTSSLTPTSTLTLTATPSLTSTRTATYAPLWTKTSPPQPTRTKAPRPTRPPKPTSTYNNPLQ